MFNRSSFLKNASYLFNTIELRDNKIVLESSDSYIPLKSIVDVDNFLDDGILSTGLIRSKEGKYYLGYTIILKNR
ncbi:MAG: hypothetical protein RMJ51_05990 [Candidatus Calescibacterium sp.]|nr:hypothetical protein [Candidatus Calescibacterium sp.]MCX7972597.1 hypothetical protein [bacterium]MDW8195768.1 hypothetical protein [Candidatus Calescibacterium sp.]